MASVVGKTIFSDGKGKLFFGYYKDNDAVEFVDYKTWKKLSFKDVSKGDTNKERVIKAILKNQKQFNKKVDFNMWAKKQKRSFEDTMDWFIQNGWINNINKGGIKESVDVLSVNEGKKRFKRQDGIGKAKYTISYHDGKKKHKDGSDFFDIKIFKNKKDLSDFVGSLVKQGYKLTNESVNEDRNSNMFYVLYQKKGVFGKPAAAGYKDRKDAEKFAKSLGNNHNTMILDKQSMKNVKGVDVNEGSMSWEKHFKGYNEKELKVISKFIFMNPQGIDGVIKMSKKKDFKPFIQKAAKKGLGESVNESASKEAMGIAALTGTRGSAVQDFIDKNRINSRKLFNALKKANLQGRINFASALAGKPGNPNAKLTIKLFGEDKKEVIAFRKKAKSEKAFYDILDKVEKKYGRGVFEKWLDKSLKDLKINPKKYRTSAEKQEALYQAKF